MPSTHTAYERLREQLELLSRPDHQEDRRTLWVVDRLLGVAVTGAGTVEILLVGDRLYPASGIVRRHLQHGRWRIEETNSEVEANRVALPAQPHFLSLAALISVELTRFGLYKAGALVDAFRQVEPLIELALRRTVLAEEHIIGLIGELLCLEVMLDATGSPEQMSSILDMWRGFTDGRDFVVGDIGIEVKTTRSMSSTHKFSGLHQVEPPAGVNNQQKVLLLSVGLSASSVEGQSLSELVDRIVKRLAGQPQPDLSGWTPLQQRFLLEVASYGQANSLGYDHHSMSSEIVYRALFSSNYTPRLYDMSDPNIRILKREYLESTHVSADDLQFRLDLPEQITQSNPAANWAQSITQLVQSALRP